MIIVGISIVMYFYLLWTWYNKDACWISSLEKFFNL